MSSQQLTWSPFLFWVPASLWIWIKISFYKSCFSLPGLLGSSEVCWLVSLLLLVIFWEGPSFKKGSKCIGISNPLVISPQEKTYLFRYKGLPTLLLLVVNETDLYSIGVTNGGSNLLPFQFHLKIGSFCFRGLHPQSQQPSPGSHFTSHLSRWQFRSTTCKWDN